MKRTSTLILLLSAFLISACGGSKAKEETTTEASTAASTPSDEWITLFNGQNFDGWEMYGDEPIMEQWQIVDGAIAANVGLGDQNAGFNRSVMTMRDFGNFELELEYKIGKGGNSGILYHVVEKKEYPQDYITGPEFQVLDDEFSRTESEAYKMVASNYAMQAPAETKKVNPSMEWNKVRLIYNNGHVEHWLNGEKVLEFEEGSDEWNEQKANGKWANSKTYAASKIGRISLQNHGDEVYYRNIRIKEL